MILLLTKLYLPLVRVAKLKDTLLSNWIWKNHIVDWIGDLLRNVLLIYVFLTYGKCSASWLILLKLLPMVEQVTHSN